MTFALVVLAFFAGAWVALIVRALIADASHRRIERAAQSLEPEHLERLRGYIGEVDNAARNTATGRSLNRVV